MLLDSRTWTGGVTTANLVKEIDEMMAIGILSCACMNFRVLLGQLAR